MIRHYVRLAAVAAVVAALVLPVGAEPARGAVIADQRSGYSEEMFCIIRSDGAACYQGAAQTITVGQTGELLGVGLSMSRRSGTTGALSVEIRAGDPGGALLATSNPVPASAIPVGGIDGAITAWTWVIFELPTPISVRAGDVIAIVVPYEPLDGFGWGLATATGDRYAGGGAWGGSVGGAWQPYVNGQDFTFQTYIQVGPSPFVDTWGTPFFSHIEWLYESGITGGCAPAGPPFSPSWRRFCQNEYVTRGQMAAFLDRALKLPGTTKDFFTDDETSMFEASINRLAAAGITGGCSARKFCPNARVRRDQMASFLARAFKLPAATKDYFTDDTGNTHEANINRLAASGITGGCSATKYCPAWVVTRGQMAAFLHRALD